MANIWCIGKRYEYLKTNTAVASSIDGQSWETFSNPFDPPINGSSICYHNGAIVALSTSGDVSYSNNGITWIKGSVGVDGFCTTGSISTSRITACGRRHYIKDQDGYESTTETAQIFDSSTGMPETWAITFSSGDTPSGFRNIKYFDSADIGNNILTQVCVVVGDRFTKPYALYSLDYAQTWTEISIDPDLDDPFFDIEYNSDTREWYFSTGGMIAIASNLISPTWTGTEIFSADYKPVTKIKLNPQKEIVALNGNTLYFSSNLINWIPFTETGYQWRSVEWFDNQWLVGAESLMTQYTFWTSQDGLTWVPDNNQIQMSSFSIQP